MEKIINSFIENVHNGIPLAIGRSERIIPEDVARDMLGTFFVMLCRNPLFDAMDAGTLKVIKKNKSFEFTNPGILKLPVEDIFRGGNSKPRNSHMQTMLRMVGFGDNAGSGFPTIVAAWDAEGWVKPELIEDTILNQVTLKLDMVKAESAVEETIAVLKSAEEDEKSVQDKVIQYCKEPRTLAEIMEHLGFTSRSQFKKHYFNNMISSGLLKRTLPDKPSSPKQQYYS